jgi:hypothetical protein
MFSSMPHPSLVRACFKVLSVKLFYFTSFDIKQFLMLVENEAVSNGARIY